MNHTIRTGDTLPGIAAHYYGDASRWRELATVNDLRAPYISDTELDQFGAQLGAYTLLSGLPSGQRNASIDAAHAARVGHRVVLVRYQTSGPPMVCWAFVAAIAGGVLTLDRALPADFVAGEQALIYASPLELRGRVLRTGDTIAIPDVAETVADLDQALQTDIYGSDLAIDAAGQLQLTSSGDLALARGLGNLAQQLRMRVQTEPGRLLRHPDYGCEAHAYLGQTHLATWQTLIAGALQTALQADPRVTQADITAVEWRDGVLVVRAQVKAANQDSIALTVGLPA